MSKKTLEDYKIDEDQADYLVTIKCRAHEGNNVYTDVELKIYVSKDVYSIEDEDWYKLVGDYVKENVPDFTSYIGELKETEKKEELKESNKNSADWFSSYSKVDDFLFKQLDALGKEFPIVDMDRPELNTIEAIKVLNNVLLIEWESKNSL